MKFNRDFINAMDGSGQLLFAFNKVSQWIVVLHLYEYTITALSALPETWKQCVFTVWWAIEASKATGCQPSHPANGLLPSARQQGC